MTHRKTHLWISLVAGVLAWGAYFIHFVQSVRAGDLARGARLPPVRDLAWRLGLDPQVTEPERRSVEIRNFIEHLVLPTRSGRGRG